MPDRENRPEQGKSEDALPGRSDAGRAFSPADLPDETPDDERFDEPRAAPAPGAPVSERELERLKEKARTDHDQTDAPAQEDRPLEGDDG